MSGFRKFRSSLHRRRRSLEAVELGFLTPSSIQGAGQAPPLRATPMTAPARVEPDAPPLEFSPSAEAREIGPTPIPWIKSRRTEQDN